MPRSRSRSMLSMNCARRSRSVSAPVASSRRSASVDLPWSMCAMIEKLRIRCVGVDIEGRAGGRGSSSYRARDLSSKCFLGLAPRGDVERELSGQVVLLQLEHEIDPLADVLGDGHLGLAVQQLELLALLRRDVDGRRDLLRSEEHTSEL